MCYENVLALFMKTIIITLFFFASFTAMAQNPYFSQYASTPLFTNPANTGLLNGDWRATATYRNDWNSVTTPFVTTSLSFDTKLFQSKTKKSSVGIGMHRTDQVAGDGNQNYRQTAISLAYHRILNRNKEQPSTLSFGIQSSLIQKDGEMHIIDWTGGPGHSGKYKVPNYLDYNLGFMYTGYINKRLSIYGGVSYFHLTKPVERILDDDYMVQPQVKTNFGGAYRVNKRFNVFFSSMYMQQGKAYEVMVGGIGGYNLSPKQQSKPKQLIAYLGTWYHYNNALVPYLGLEYYTTRLGITYGVQTNNLVLATQGTKGFELSLVCAGGFGKNRINNSNLGIPQF